MPKNFDMSEYESATSSTGGDYKRLVAGGYVARIQSVRTSGKDGYGREIDYPEEKQYIKLIYDIAEGEFEGIYSDDFWADPENDYRHQIYLSWKNMGAFKGSVRAIEESNPGFDFMAAFNADRYELIVGKLVGIVVGEEEYTANDGSTKTRLGFPRLKSVQDIKAGKFRVPELKKLDGGKAEPAPVSTPLAAAAAQAAAEPSGGFEYDLPF